MSVSMKFLKEDTTKSDFRKGIVFALFTRTKFVAFHELTPVNDEVYVWVRRLKRHRVAQQVN